VQLLDRLYILEHFYVSQSLILIQGSNSGYDRVDVLEQLISLEFF